MTRESFFLWVMHRFAERFDRHAILKGGMALFLVGCPRSTNDLDYIFVPFQSKKEISGDIEKVLKEIPGASLSVTANSKALFFIVECRGVMVQIEAHGTAEPISLAA